MRYLLIAIAILFATTPALAQPYAILGAGQGQATVSASPSEVEAVGWQVGFGYRFTRHLGAEAAFHYVDATESGPVAANQFTNVDSTSRTFTLAAVGELPFGDKWAVIGKLGAAHVRHTLASERIQLSPFGSLSLTETTETDTGSLVGIGLRWGVARLMLEQIDGLEGIGLDRLRFISVQVAVPF